jgi:hypothetical protein
LEENDQESSEESPLGLILCAGGGQESIALLRLDQAGIRVGQYLTELPPKKVLERKLRESIALSRALLESRAMTQARIGPSSKRKREDQTDDEQTPRVEKLRAAAAYKVDTVVVTPRVKQESAAKERGGIDILAVLSNEGKGNVMAGAACAKRRPPQLGGLKLQTVLADSETPDFRFKRLPRNSEFCSGA